MKEKEFSKISEEWPILMSAEGVRNEFKLIKKKTSLDYLNKRLNRLLFKEDQGK